MRTPSGSPQKNEKCHFSHYADNGNKYCKFPVMTFYVFAFFFCYNINNF